MNDLTRKLVIEVAKKNKAVAKRNDQDFYCLVMQEHNLEMWDTIGFDVVERFCHLLTVLVPGVDIMSIRDKIIERGFYILERKCERDPELRLTDDWGQLPVLTADPQLQLFEVG